MNCNSDEKIYELKIKIFIKGGLPYNNVRLIFSGIQLEDNRTIGDYKIQKESSIVYVLRLRGW